MFELSALQSALPADAATSAPAEAEATPGAAPAASSAEAATSQLDVRPVKGGRGAGPQGGRGAGRESSERWSKEAPRGGGRGGGGTGGRGTGRTVEVTTGSYVIEKPLDDDESGSRGGGKGPVKTTAVGRKGPKDSSNTVAASREEGAKGFAAAGKHSKPAPPSSSAREAREPRQPGRSVDAAGSGDAGEGSGAKESTRPKSGGPGSKLFDSAMKQANPKMKKVSRLRSTAMYRDVFCVKCELIGC